jgi:serine/threonine protein kinase
VAHLRETMPSDELQERAGGRLGTVLRGKYRLDRVLGVGGMAAVYKATHRNQAEFAIKMLHPELSLNEDVRTRFLREGYAANSVKHPGAVRVVDDDIAEDGAAFLVMELLDGVVCENLVPETDRLPLDAACAIALELLEVLAAAHAQGIIHRDIKPANLFLLRDGSVKVLDFGIARVKDTMGGGNVRATGTGLLLGTPAFMAPEQAIGKASDVDARADLWAVGATIFGLASGELIHDAETAAHLLVKLATEQPRSLRVVVPGAPPAIVAVVDRALTLDKHHRWPAATDMRDGLASAFRASFGDVAPRALLASLVASQPKAPAPSGAAWTGKSAFLPTAASPPPNALLPRVFSSASVPSLGAVAAATPHVVDTGTPVSGERPGGTGQTSAAGLVRAPGTGGARRMVVTLIAFAAFAALGSAAGFAFVVREHKTAAPEATSAPLVSAKGSDSASALPIASAAVNPPREVPGDAGAPAVVVVAPSAAAPSAAKKEESPRREAQPRPTPTPRPGHAPAQTKPEPPPAARPPPPATQPPVSPSPDPLDGRR